MKLTNEQIKELRQTGKVEFPFGTIKRIEYKQNKYFNMQEKKFKPLAKKKVQYKVILSRDFVTYLRVMDGV